MKKLAIVVFSGLLGVIAAFFSRSDTSEDSVRIEPTPTSKYSEIDSSGRAARRGTAKSVHVLQSKPRATRDPLATSYNVVELATLDDVPVQELFDAEPRNEDWANVFEPALDSYVEAALLELFDDIEVRSECRTATCSVEVRGQADEMERISEIVQTQIPIGEVMSVSSSEEDPNQLVVYGGLPPDLLDPPAFFEKTAQFRDTIDDAIVQTRTMLRDDQ